MLNVIVYVPYSLRIRRQFFHGGIHSVWKATRRRNIPKQNISNGISSFFAAVKRLYCVAWRAITQVEGHIRRYVGLTSTIVGICCFKFGIAILPPLMRTRINVLLLALCAKTCRYQWLLLPFLLDLNHNHIAVMCAHPWNGGCSRHPSCK